MALNRKQTMSPRAESFPAQNDIPLQSVGHRTDPDHIIHAPFDGNTPDELHKKVDEFLKETQIGGWEEDIRKGAFLAQDDQAFNRDRPDIGNLSLSPEEKADMDLEANSKWKPWKQPRKLQALIFLCGIGAAVQGWDESAVGGGQLFYRWKFSINNKPGILGLVNSAPYLCCAFSCLLTQYLNDKFGRRGTIVLTTWISAIACLLQAFSPNWICMFFFRLLLGLGIGPKSATIPIFAAESAPQHIRGTLVMVWQLFTALGIMLGYVMGLAFGGVQGGYGCGDKENLRFCGLNWRLIMGSPLVLPILLAAYILTVPESARWLLRQAHITEDSKKKKKYYQEAFLSLRALRHSTIQAGRDMFLVHHILRIEEELWEKKGKTRPRLFELLNRRRNARAFWASLITMTFQQFCGVNVIVYYSTVIFSNLNIDVKNSLILSLAFGVINFLFAIPALYYIDRAGRRPLLLWTFPVMALCQFLIGGASKVKDITSQQWLVVAFMYCFSIAYSIGEGPVPFVYASESMPLYIRDFGMGWATAVLWFFNFFLAITWPSFVRAFGDMGAFFWYGAFNILGFIMIYLFVPETKVKSLEDLDKEFERGVIAAMPQGVQRYAKFVARNVFRQRFEEG